MNSLAFMGVGLILLPVIHTLAHTLPSELCIFVAFSFEIKRNNMSGQDFEFLSISEQLMANLQELSRFCILYHA